ncbi:MAG TPA: diguanylate cyclase [Spirochaetia bacterium]|nr:diguanylate cyclase [Spirochaetia bacterium]
MENEREESVQFMRLVLDENPNPVLCVSRDGTLLYANQGSSPLLDHWKIRVGQLVPRDWREIVRGTLENHKEQEVEIRVGIKTLLLHTVALKNGTPCVNLYGMDVTRRRHAEEKLRLTAQVIDNTTEGIMITDTDFRILEINKSFCAITGYSREEVLGESVLALHTGPQEAGFYEGIWDIVRIRGSWRGEIWDRKKNGDVYPKWMSVSAVADERGEITRFVGIFSDITPMKKTDEQLYHMAHYDSLTGLANRRQFHDLLRRALKTARRKKESIAIMFIDVDSFKEVNDTFGHRTGDQLLQEIGKRIQGCVRETDVVARLGGDEFTVILGGLQDPESVEPVARKLLQRLAQPVMIEQKEVRVTSSIGISILADDTSDPDSLIQNADLAMYRAKAHGKNTFQIF